MRFDEDENLGMDAAITRRDFLNGALIGAGAVLLSLPSPRKLWARESGWGDEGGVGDYGAANGNTWDVAAAGHGIRDGLYSGGLRGAETGEHYDLVVVGGGISGLGAALRFVNRTAPSRSCLVLENHPIVGGEAKRNRFEINGQVLFGPQGANAFAVPARDGLPGYSLYKELGLPVRYDYVPPAPEARHLWFDRTSYGFMLWFDAPSVGTFFPGDGGAAPRLVREFSKRGIDDAPYDDRIRRDFARWLKGPGRIRRGEALFTWLDSMSYKDYVERELGLNAEITRYVDPVVASSLGLGADAVSAYAAYQIGMPGFYPFEVRGRVAGEPPWHSFPGGIDGIGRYLLKRIVPDAIQGGTSFADIYHGAVRFDALDRPGNRVRIRCGATVVGVEHVGSPGNAESVKVSYVVNGKLFSAAARNVVVASGSWVSRRIVRDLPENYRRAYASFFRSPILVVNVGLTNWRFLLKLGITAARWFEGFGFACNIRQPMKTGVSVPLAPDEPAVLTFYVPFYYPGLPAREQGVRGREELFSTSFRDFERKIRNQMTKLFGSAGFDPRKDIGAIILNRWGHAYVNPQPGFYYSAAGGPAPRDVVRQPFGRIAFGHSEHNGHQHWVAAAEEGARAVDRLMET